ASTTHACLVCSVAIKETHLGINSCRACALFFKRTRRTRRGYTCRRGTGKCVFKKHEPFACKKCRFDRCIAIGMNNGSEGESILDRIKEEYENSLKRRIDAERRIAEIHEIPRVETSQELYQTTASFYYDTYPIALKELIVLLTSVIPDFDDFTNEMKFSILENLLGKFYALNSFYHTSKIYLKTGKCMATAISCFDIDSSDQWINESEVMAKIDSYRSIAPYCSSLQAHARDFLELFYKMLRTDDITEREFHALIAITFCELAMQIPDRIQCVFDGVRTKVLNELQCYYKEQLNLSDYSLRLGNLMSLTAAISEIHVISAEQHRLYATLFDIKSEEELLNDAIVLRLGVSK
ncbi:hypothetical protein PENTCL1PPCAC_25683, partial [Pristionchus entomophagus]